MEEEEKRTGGDVSISRDSISQRVRVEASVFNTCVLFHTFHHVYCTQGHIILCPGLFCVDDMLG